jgi:hypothetical protein
MPADFATVNAGIWSITARLPKGVKVLMIVGLEKLWVFV